MNIPTPSFRPARSRPFPPRSPLRWRNSSAASRAMSTPFIGTISGGRFQSHVTFGMLTASLYSTLAGVYLPGKYSLIHSIDRISFNKPVFAGDVLTVTGTLTGKQDDLKLIQVAVKITNQDGKCVSKADMKILVQK